MPRKDAYGGSISAQAQQDLVSEGIENFELPKSVVTKIAKSAIPDTVKLQKETVLSLVKGSTVFINYLAATAHDVAQSRQHKSISASDVIKALEILQFRTMYQDELNSYRELAKQAEARPKKTGTASTSATSKKTVTSNTAGGSSSASASTKGKGKERAVPAIPLPPPFTSTPLPLAVGMVVGADTKQGSIPPAESISASGVGEREDEPMDVDPWTSHVADGVPQDLESGGFKQDAENELVESAPVQPVP